MLLRGHKNFHKMFSLIQMSSSKVIHRLLSNNHVSHVTSPILRSGSPTSTRRSSIYAYAWGGPQAQVGVAYEEIDAVEAFKVCNTSRKKGMRDVAREVVISPCTCLFALLGF